LLKLDPAKIDRAAVTQALSHVSGVKSDILCSDWYYAKGSKQQNAVHVTRMALLADGVFKTIQDCVATEDPELKPLLAYEAGQ
jgi:branched-chain amino acid transport system substrate-binding protein